MGEAPEHLHRLVGRGALVENDADHQNAGHSRQTLVADVMLRHGQAMLVHAVQPVGQQFAETDAGVAAFGLNKGETRP